MQVFLRSLLTFVARPGHGRTVALVAAMGMFLAVFTLPANAQYGLPPSPAFGVGQRIQKEAEAAWASADAFAKAGKQADSDTQRRIAKIRANQAISQYGVVMASATYKRTAVAAEATLYSARLENGILLDPDKAIQTYKLLQNNFSSVAYEDKASAELEADVVAKALDQKHKTATWETVQWFFPIPFPAAAAYRVMDFLVDLTGRTSQSYWLAIIMISVIVKLITAGLSAKQFKSLKETQKLQPYIKELQAKYKNDKEVLGKKMMELYQEHGINPMAGCGPLFIQLPVMFLLYNTIRIYEFQFRHGTFLWIGSPLAKLYPQVVAADLGLADIPLLGFYMLSMYVQMRMTTPADPQQAEQQRMMSVWMPFMTGFFFLQGHWPSAFILYYLTFNVLSMLQQQWYMKWRKEGPGDGPTTGSGTETPSLSVKAKDNGSSSSKYADNGAGNTAYGNGTRPTAKGAIAPKVHPKKKRR